MFPKRLIALTLFAALAYASTPSLRAQCKGPDDIDFCQVDSARLEVLLDRFPCIANRLVGSDIVEQRTPLIQAIECDRPEIVQVLLNHGARIELIINDYRNLDPTYRKYSVLDKSFPSLMYAKYDPIWIAFESSDHDTMLALLLRHASKNPNQVNDRKRFNKTIQDVLDTCFSNSELFRDSTLIEELIAHGAKLNPKSRDWVSIAVEQQSPDMLKFWLSKGALVNKHDKNGDTPLYRAQISLDSISEQREIDRGLTDPYGDSRWLQSDEDNFKKLSEIVEILEQSGGKK